MSSGVSSGVSSFVTASTEQIAAAAADVSSIEAAVTQANATAALPTTEVLAAAGDEVSAAVAKLFGDFGRDYQSIGAHVAEAQNHFAQMLSGAQTSYTNTEAEITALLGSPSELSGSMSASGTPGATGTAPAAAADYGWLTLSQRAAKFIPWLVYTGINDYVQTLPSFLQQPASWIGTGIFVMFNAPAEIYLTITGVPNREIFATEFIEYRPW